MCGIAGIAEELEQTLAVDAVGRMTSTLGGLVVNAWEYLGEARVERKQLKDFPKQIGIWEQTASDEQFNQETLAVLRSSDYLLRNYRGAAGRTVNFYVATTRANATAPLITAP